MISVRTSQPIQAISNQNSHDNSIRTSPQGIDAFAMNSSIYNIPRMDQSGFVPSSIMATEITRNVVGIIGIQRFSTKHNDTINNNRRKTIRLTDDRNGPHQIHHIHGLALTRNQIIVNMTTNVAHGHCRPSFDDTPFGTQIASMTETFIFSGGVQPA
ncbi:unnamed protein product [Rotaria magnacalcarata]|uniref:Uncharacterized protein n=2 Tax=Rotaria magnacalcarata TaxID=392030 RepID=A0A816TM99_9BILA|nr:unnamed protein product [Rotaria magnacalcarata]CAF2098390.1 unnamed protein product [Rotaria magnacalcarata]